MRLLITGIKSYLRRVFTINGLAVALASGQLAGAAFDVRYPEPLPHNHFLWSINKAILKPQSGWKALELRNRLVVTLADNIRAVLENAPINVATHSRSA